MISTTVPVRSDRAKFAALYESLGATFRWNGHELKLTEEERRGIANIPLGLGGSAWAEHYTHVIRPDHGGRSPRENAYIAKEVFNKTYRALGHAVDFGGGPMKPLPADTPTPAPVLSVIEAPAMMTLPAGLRALAESIEAGKFDDAHNLVWVIDGGDHRIHVGMLGQCGGSGVPGAEAHLLLALAQRQLEGV